MDRVENESKAKLVSRAISGISLAGRSSCAASSDSFYALNRCNTLFIRSGQKRDEHGDGHAVRLRDTLIMQVNLESHTVRWSMNSAGTCKPFPSCWRPNSCRMSATSSSGLLPRTRETASDCFASGSKRSRECGTASRVLSCLR